ncbi:extracellular calcium-sensing receptor-like [Leptodactylus fuscus]|uniref:extracellular calcium-sensing receptor-like n=1 Tax=Leptodactylus fuscus TaxID=238119 RepID=UPI003F4EEFF5
MSLAPPSPQYNTEDKPDLIIVDCNDRSHMAFWVMLGYLFLLATISFIVAFLARKLPDSFNETQFITFTKPIDDDYNMVRTYMEFIEILLLHPMIVFHSMAQMCKLPPTSDLEGIRQSGDIMIGGLLPVNTDKIYQKLTFNIRPPKTNCTLFSLEYYHRIQSFLFSIEEINQDPNILPNMTLGFQMYDPCNIPHYDLQGALQFLTDSRKEITDKQCSSRPLFTVTFGATISPNSIILAHVLGTIKYPQVSSSSGISLLSNKKMFPSFFRTIPSDVVQSKALAQLILSFGWTWIGLVALDNDYGLQGIQPIKEEIVKAGACVAFMEYIILGQPDRNAPRIVQAIKESTATVIVVFSIEADLVPILNELVKQNITGKIFIANAGWSRSALLSITNYLLVLSGSLGLFVEDYVVPGLSQFLAKIHPSTSRTARWTRMYWEKVFACQFLSQNQTASLENPVKICTGSERIEDVRNNSNYISSLKTTYAIYSAVHLVSKALEDMKSCKVGEGPFTNGTCVDIGNFKPWQLTYYIQRARPKIKVDNAPYFNENGDAPGVYNIINWQMKPDRALAHVKIGLYNNTAPPHQTLTMNTSQIMWNLGSKQVPSSRCSNTCTLGFRKAVLKGKPPCCYDCLPCLQGEISNQTDSLNCFRCPWDQWPNPEKSMCLPKPIEFLSYEDILGVSLAATSVISSIVPALLWAFFLHHKYTPLVKASNYSLSCLLLMSLSLCFFSSLGFIGYPDHGKCLLRQVSFGLIFTLCVACILAKTIMVVFAFMATRPGSSLRKWTTLRVSYSIICICLLLQLLLCITWTSLAPPSPQYNTEDKPDLIIVDCNDRSHMAFWVMLGYLFLLATISFIVAFLARKLPDSFNEAQFITFSMLAFLSVWISFIPSSLSARGKYTVAMEVFAILGSSWALLICMFFPKCFILLFRPEMNSKEYLMIRTISR